MGQLRINRNKGTTMQVTIICILTRGSAPTWSTPSRQQIRGSFHHELFLGRLTQKRTDSQEEKQANLSLLQIRADYIHSASEERSVFKKTDSSVVYFEEEQSTEVVCF